MSFNRVLPPQAGSHRAGFTLIEMLVAITLSASTMLTAVALVHRAFEYEVAVRQRVQETNSFNRFVEQFRHDVHEASHVSAIANGMELASPDGGLITYASAGNVLTRVCQQGAQRHRERVALSLSATATFEIESDPSLALLTVDGGEQTRGTRQLPRHIVVAVGGLHENLSQPGQQGLGTKSVEEQL